VKEDDNFTNIPPLISSDTQAKGLLKMIDKVAQDTYNILVNSFKTKEKTLASFFLQAERQQL
jgi:hypothetical protein